MTKEKLVGGIDLGGTNIVSAVVTSEGRVLASDKRPSQTKAENRVTFDEIAEALRVCLKNCGKDIADLSGICLSSPGPLSIKREVAISPTNFPKWGDVYVLDELRKRGFEDIPMCLQNDANAAAYGESWMGAGKDANSLVALTLGTGVGGGIVLDGEIWNGADDVAGEIGHTTMFMDGRPCNCGSVGCLEQYVSATGIAITAREHINSGRDTILKEMCNNDPGVITSRMVYEAALEKDAVAMETMAFTSRILGAALGSLMNIFNPDVIVLCGGVIKAGEMLLTPAREEAARRAFKIAANRCQVLPAALGGDAGVIGAAGIAAHKFVK
ncbi:ROK family protein [Candidatus Hydrogenedentota bacterium]